MAEEAEDFPVRVDVLQANPGLKKNSIITSKYNLLTFLPMQLFELLHVHFMRMPTTVQTPMLSAFAKLVSAHPQDKRLRHEVRGVKVHFL